MYSRSPMLAGLYFTSGTQEGTTVSRYFRRVGEQLGLAPEALGRTFGEQVQKRPYFVRHLFWKVVAPSTGLTVPVDSEKDARRRMLLGISAVAGSFLLGLLATISFVRNGTFVAAYPARLSEKLAQTTEISDQRVEESLHENLQAFGEAADVVAELDRHPILDDWGLNKRGRLRADARELFRDHFEKKFWSSFGPYLTSGLEAGQGANLSCEDRTNLMLGYLGLLGADPGTRPPVQAAKRLLDTLLTKSETADQENLAKAWAIFGEGKKGERSEPDLSAPARVVADACFQEANPVAAIQGIQNDCWPSPVENCFPRLQAIARVSQEVLDSRRKSFEELARQLGKAQVDDDTRKRVGEVLEELKRAGGHAKGGGLLARLGGSSQAQAATQDGAGCVGTYFKSVSPDLQALVAQAEKYHASMEKQHGMGAAGQASVVQAAAAQAFADIEQSLKTKVEILNAACEGADLKSAALVLIARGHVSGFIGGRRRPGVTASYAREEWTAKCGRLGNDKQGLVLGGARPEVQARGVAAIERDARAYSDQFERYWTRELGRPDPSIPAGDTDRGAAAVKASLDRVRKEVDGLQCPTVPSLEAGPRRVAEKLQGLQGSVDAYEQALTKAFDWIEEQIKTGKRAEVVDQTMRGAGPVAEVCSFIDNLRQPDLTSALRAPVLLKWNGAVLGGMAANIKTAWQQKMMGVSELTRRYPFKSSGDTHASLQVAQAWLDPKAGKLVQLYYQMAPAPSDGKGGPPCDLRVKSNIGPQTTGFLRRAKEASDLVFQDADQGKSAQRLTFTFRDTPQFADPGAADKYGVTVTQVVLVLAGERLTYILDQPTPRPLTVPLPSAAPVNSYLEVSVVGKGRKSDVRPARLERGGEWSPLALLKLADREPIPGGDGVRLTWKVPYGSGAPFLQVTCDADARVKRLLETDLELDPTDTPDR